MPKPLKILLLVLGVLLVLAAVRLAFVGGASITAPPAMTLERLGALGDDQLVSQLTLDWTWRRSPPEGQPAGSIPEPARHLLAIVGNESGIRSHGLVSIAVVSRGNPAYDDLNAIARAYEAIGATAVGRLIGQAAAIAGKEDALLDQWRDHLAQKATRPARDPFGDLDRQVQAELAAPGLRQKLVAYLRRHLAELAGGG
jgi:hypothetical protein